MILWSCWMIPRETSLPTRLSVYCVMSTPNNLACHQPCPRSALHSAATRRASWLIWGKLKCRVGICFRKPMPKLIGAFLHWETISLPLYFFVSCTPFISLSLSLWSLTTCRSSSCVIWYIVSLVSCGDFNALPAGHAPHYDRPLWLELKWKSGVWRRWLLTDLLRSLTIQLICNGAQWASTPHASSFPLSFPSASPIILLLTIPHVSQRGHTICRHSGGPHRKWFTSILSPRRW